jgi:maltose O-acetyltransferase
MKEGFILIRKIIRNISESYFIFICKIAGSVLLAKHIRVAIYKLLGMNIKTNNIFPNSFISSNKISIGRGTFINRRCFFDAADYIDIGQNCSIAMEVMFCTSSHKVGAQHQRASENTTSAIKIGNGVWIGTRAIILPGITIGDGCIIAAGTVVNKNCEPNGLYGGNPAKRIKELAV